MDDEGGEYETPQPDLSLYHDYIDPVYGYDSVDVTSQSRDVSSQYEQLPPGVDARPHEYYTPLSGLTTATSSSEPPAYQPSGDGCGPTVQQQQQQQQQPVASVTIIRQQVPGVVSRRSQVAPAGGCVRRQSVVVGILLLVLALLCAVFNIVSLVATTDTLVPLGYHQSVAYACHGLWGGLLCFVTGALAVAAGRTTHRCTVIALMVMSIITSVACFVQLTIASAAAAVIHSDVTYCRQFSRPRRSRLYFTSSSTSTLAPADAAELCNKVEVVYVLETLLAVLGGLAAVVCIYVSAICCRATCSCCCCADHHSPSSPSRQPHHDAYDGQNGLPPAPVTAVDQHGQLVMLSYVVTPQQQQQQPMATAPPYHVINGHSQSQLLKY